LNGSLSCWALSGGCCEDGVSLCIDSPRGRIQIGGLMMAEKAEAKRSQRSGATSLAREQALYEANQQHWILDHAGKHVLIRDTDVVGFFDSRDEALTAGYSRLCVCPLFVKQVGSSEAVHHIPNILL
jgi:hypothetical protein